MSNVSLWSSSGAAASPVSASHALSPSKTFVTGAGLAANNAPSPRLVKAAHEFEAAMMKELMAPMTSGQDGFGSEQDSGSSSALTSFASEALGKAISERGGFGIARNIIQQLSSHGNHSGKSPVTTIQNGDTVKTGLK